MSIFKKKLSLKKKKKTTDEGQLKTDEGGARESILFSFFTLLDNFSCFFVVC